MPDKWMTVAAAAATLNVHPRTIERRIASGKIESRRTDDGQLQVLINAPDDSSAGAEAFETVDQFVAVLAPAHHDWRQLPIALQRPRHGAFRFRHV